MAQIHLLPDNQHIEIGTSETILDASLGAGIKHAHACGGNAMCSTCRVIILEGNENMLPRNPDEQELADELGFTPSIRLACQAQVTGDVRIRRPVLDDLDESIVNQMGKGGSIVQKIGEARSLGILFADIAGYTPFAESLPPYDIIHVLNRYFHLMGEVINNWNGRIIDYYGDGILAVFGTRQPESAALDSVQAGKEMLKSLDKLNPYLNTMYGKSFSIRIGIHYGEVVTGTVGIENMTKFAVIGDAVNFASRIDTANKELGTQFLISEDTYREVEKEISVNSCHEVPLKGKTGLYKLYEVLAEE